MKNTPIESYTYHIVASRDVDDVTIYLYDAHSDVIGEVFFVGDGVALPPSMKKGGRSHLYYRRSRFTEVIDLLRHEGPVYLVWRDGMVATLSTGFEPVGEAERHE